VTERPITDAPEPGTMTAIDVDGVRVAVANVDGVLHAFPDLCPHRQCSLSEGTIVGAVVTCPCHESQFDVTTGDRLRGPAVRAIPVFTVRHEDGGTTVVLP
jgi:nitrite reductase/ring-hydroxylating ferredoxin subunit